MSHLPVDRPHFEHGAEALGQDDGAERWCLVAPDLEEGVVLQTPERLHRRLEHRANLDGRGRVRDSSFTARLLESFSRISAVTVSLQRIFLLILVFKNFKQQGNCDWECHWCLSFAKLRTLQV